MNFRKTPIKQFCKNLEINFLYFTWYIMSEGIPLEFKEIALQNFKFKLISTAISSVVCIVIIILMIQDVIPVSNIPYIYILPGVYLAASVAAFGYCLYNYLKLLSENDKSKW